MTIAYLFSNYVRLFSPDKGKGGYISFRNYRRDNFCFHGVGLESCYVLFYFSISRSYFFKIIILISTFILGQECKYISK